MVPEQKQEKMSRTLNEVTKESLGITSFKKKRVVSCDQNSYVKVRLIFDAVRTIDNVLGYTKQSGKSGNMVTIDFEKVFVALDHELQIKVLYTFSFGPSFFQWIRTFYSNV